MDSTPQSGLDKLALVSKLLLDSRVLELLQENETFRLELSGNPIR